MFAATNRRLHLSHIAQLLAAIFTVARVLKRLGLGRFRVLEPKPPLLRYERERPVDLIHIDVKKLARFRKVWHRITGNRQQGRSTGVGYERVHVVRRQSGYGALNQIDTGHLLADAALYKTMPKELAEANF